MGRLAALTLFAMALSAQPPAAPAVGSKAPIFKALDQNGQTHTLASLLGPNGAIVVFYRSADW